MINKFFLYLLVVSPLFGQTLINRSEKITIKRKMYNFNSYIDFDFRTTNERGFYYRHSDFGVNIPLTKTWLTSFQYRNIYTQSKGSWKLEKRPKALIQKTINTRTLKWSVRSLQEYRIRDSKDDALRNRVRVMAKSNTNWNGLKLFAGNEFFYDMEKKEYNKNWLVVGFDLSKVGFTAPTIYYKHISDYVNGKWIFSYTMVFKVTI